MPILVWLLLDWYAALLLVKVLIRVLSASMHWAGGLVTYTCPRALGPAVSNTGPTWSGISTSL